MLINHALSVRTDHSIGDSIMQADFVVKKSQRIGFLHHCRHRHDDRIVNGSRVVKGKERGHCACCRLHPAGL